MAKEKTLTLEAAFKKVIGERGLLTQLGYGRYQVANFKRQTVSAEKMREVVKAAGYKLVQPELYTLKS